MTIPDKIPPQTKQRNISLIGILIKLCVIDKVINDIMTFIRSINVFMEKNEPWKLVKSDKVQAGNILYHCAESLRLAAVMLSPVMPSKTKDILNILGTNNEELVWGKLKSGSKISTSEPIFPRIS